MEHDSVMEAYKISVTVWITILLASLAGLILIQLTTWFGGIGRGRVWYSSMLAWVIFCFSSSLLFISGQQPKNEHQVPNHVVCLVQASLMYSGTPLSIATVVSLFLELYLKVLFTYSQNKIVLLEKRARSSLFLILPYGFWCLLLTLYLAFGATNPSKVKFNGLDPYCTFDHPVLQMFSSIISIILLLAAMILKAMIVVVLIKINRQLDARPSTFPGVEQYIIIFIRFSIMWIASVVAVVITIMFSIQKHINVIDHVVSQAIVPLVVVIIFGSQKDILLKWKEFFWNFYGKLRNIGTSKTPEHPKAQDL